MDPFCGKRKGQLGEVRLVKAKRKPRAGTQKRWTDAEAVSILDYMRRTILENGQIEAPTASLYYGAMIKELQLQDINVIKLKAKVTNLKTQYTKAVEWRNRTGQSVLPVLAEGHLLKVCPHFELLDEIYGPKAGALPPSIAAGEAPDTEVGFEINEKVSSLVELIMSDAAPSDDEACPTEEEDLKAAAESRASGKAASMDSVALVTALTEAQNRRTEMLTLKHKVEMQRLEYEHAFQVQNLAFKEKELALAEKRHETERELRILEMEKDERVARFKIEQDAKLQLELAKLKS